MIKTNIKKLTVLIAVILLITGCEKLENNNVSTASDTTNASENVSEISTESETNQETINQPVNQTVKQPEKEIDPIKEQIKNMTTKEKIGQMVIVGLEGYKMNDSAKTMIENYHVGGFILFSRNVESSNQLWNLVNSLKDTNIKNKIPLFISVDEEGGKVSRMPADVKKLPSNEKMGDINNSDFSYEIGGILAKETQSFGFNMDFAPVLDINSNPQNPVIGDRSFGTNAEVVSKLGVQTMKGIQAGGIIPVVKHFPGHGDTSVDSHVGLPAVDNDIERLKSFELVPFIEAIKNGADAVMVAHILLSKIDPNNPASMSKAIVTDILRKQLNFNGVVISDDMTMGAIIKNYNIGHAAVKSVNAGTDLILVCHEHDNEVAVIDALNKAADAGIISKDRIDESVYRILKLKNKYNLTDRKTDTIDVDKINNKISNVLKTYLK